jgi:hypothetical protein
LAEEFGYLAVILDAFSRKVVGKAIEADFASCTGLPGGGPSLFDTAGSSVFVCSIAMLGRGRFRISADELAQLAACSTTRCGHFALKRRGRFHLCGLRVSFLRVVQLGF